MQVSLTAAQETGSAPSSTLALVILALAVIGCLPLFGLLVPLWLQPSLVGLLWGSLFLGGCWLTIAGSCSWLMHLLVLVGAASLTTTFHRVTDLSIEESLLACVMLVACGWMMFRIDRNPWKVVSGQPMALTIRQIPLTDLFLLTTLAACIVRAATHMTSPPLMLIGIMGTLVVGCVYTWAAYHWAFNDARPVGAPMVLAVMLSLVGIGIVLYASPMSIRELCVWLLQGPLSVIATQCFTVLAVFGIMRVQPARNHGRVLSNRLGN
jgi:hypothetical protein